MYILPNNDDLSEGSEVEYVFGVNRAVNADTNAGVEANVPNGGNIPASPGVPISRNGSIQQGLPWTGGPRNPALRMQFPKSDLCYHHMQILQQKVFSRSEKGVGSDWLIKTKSAVPLSLSAVKIKDGIVALGLDSVFDIQIRGLWVSLAGLGL